MPKKNKSKMVAHLTVRELLKIMDYHYRMDNLTDPEPGVVIPDAAPPFPWAHGGYIKPTTTTTGVPTSTGIKWTTSPITSVSVTFDSVTTTKSELDKNVVEELKKTIGKYSAKFRRSI